MHSLPNRQSKRLKGYDYTRNGLYFITIVCQDRNELFGEIIDCTMVLNDAGRMVVSEWCSLSMRFPNVELDAFVVMPNHMHGILILDDVNVGTPLVPRALLQSRKETCLFQGMGVRKLIEFPDIINGGQAQGQSLQVKTIGDIIGAFKSITTNRYINGVKLGLVPPFRKRLYHRHNLKNGIENSYFGDGKDDSMTTLYEMKKSVL